MALTCEKSLFRLPMGLVVIKIRTTSAAVRVHQFSVVSCRHNRKLLLDFTTEKSPRELPQRLQEVWKKTENRGNNDSHQKHPLEQCLNFTTANFSVSFMSPLGGGASAAWEWNAPHVSAKFIVGLGTT